VVGASQRGRRTEAASTDDFDQPPHHDLEHNLLMWRHNHIANDASACIVKLARKTCGRLPIGGRHDVPREKRMRLAWSRGCDNRIDYASASDRRNTDAGAGANDQLQRLVYSHSGRDIRLLWHPTSGLPAAMASIRRPWRIRRIYRLLLKWDVLRPRKTMSVAVRPRLFFADHRNALLQQHDCPLPRSSPSMSQRMRQFRRNRDREDAEADRHIVGQRTVHGDRFLEPRPIA
jgi:hypothetical protein